MGFKKGRGTLIITPYMTHVTGKFHYSYALIPEADFFFLPDEKGDRRPTVVGGFEALPFWIETVKKELNSQPY